MTHTIKKFHSKICQKILNTSKKNIYKSDPTNCRLWEKKKEQYIPTFCPYNVINKGHTSPVTKTPWKKIKKIHQSFNFEVNFQNKLNYNLYYL